MNGCSTKCPCRVWWQCSRYVDEHEKRRRLAAKVHEAERREYYEVMFKLDAFMPDFVCSG